MIKTPIDNEELVIRAKSLLKIKDLRDKLNQVSTTDELTGLHNRRYLHERLEQEMSRAKRYGTKLSCLLFDLDFFKVVNDIYGYEWGDVLLRSIADKLKQLGYTGSYHAKIENENMIIGNKFLYLKCNRKIYVGKVPISIDIRDIGEEDSGENEINIPLMVNVTKDNPKGELKQLHITKNISGLAEPRYRNEKVANDILKNKERRHIR